MEPQNQPIGWYTELTLAFADGTTQNIEIERKLTGTHIPRLKGSPAPWTKLGFQKCPCCPLPGEAGWCPAAISLQTTLDRLRHRTSTEIVTATAVDARGRRETVTWPLQLVGAVMVQLAVFASECPVGRRVKPHLQGLSPFTPANELLRHVLGGILGPEGGSAESVQRAVSETIEPLHQVFSYLFRRLSGGGSASHEDAIPNSIVHVDTFAQMMAYRANRLTEKMTSELGWKEPPKPKEEKGLWARLRSLFKA